MAMCNGEVVEATEEGKGCRSARIENRVWCEGLWVTIKE